MNITSDYNQKRYKLIRSSFNFYNLIIKLSNCGCTLYSLLLAYDMYKLISIFTIIISSSSIFIIINVIR